MTKRVYKNVCLPAFTFFIILAAAIVLNGNVVLAEETVPCIKGAFFYPDVDYVDGNIVIQKIDRDSNGNIMSNEGPLDYVTETEACNWRHLFIDFKFYDAEGNEDKSVTGVSAADFNIEKYTDGETTSALNESDPELKLEDITFSTATVNNIKIVGDGKKYINVVGEVSGRYKLTYIKDGNYKNKSIDVYIGVPDIALYANNDETLKLSSRMVNGENDIIEYDHTKSADLEKNEYYLMFGRNGNFKNTSVSMETESRYIDESNRGEYKVEKVEDDELIYKVTVPKNRKGTFLLKFDVTWERPEDSDNGGLINFVEDTKELQYLFVDAAKIPAEIEDKRPKSGFSGMLMPGYDYDNNGDTCWYENPYDMEQGYNINYEYPKYWVHADTVQGVLDILAEIATTGKDSGKESGIPENYKFDTKLEYYAFIAIDTSSGKDAEKNAAAIQNVKPDSKAFKGVFFTAEEENSWTWPELYLDATVPIKVGAKSNEQLNIHAGFPAGATASECNPISIVRRVTKKDEEDNEYIDWQSKEDVKKIVAGSTAAIPGVKQEAYVIPKSVEKGIKIKTAPVKTSYMEGESFDKTGMVVEVMCNDGKSKPVTDYTLTVASPLTTDVNEVVITYGGYTVKQPIKVTAKPVDKPADKPEDKPVEKPVQGSEVKIPDNKDNGSYTVSNGGTVNNGKVEGAEVTYKPAADAAVVNVPETVTDANGVSYAVTSIDKDAFKNNKKITSVTISDSITKIDDNAFSGCTKLKTVKLGKGVTTIGNKAFYKCTSLTKITIPKNVTKIGKSAFEGCTKLKTITLKTKKLKTVGSKAIKGIHKKATIKVPDKKTLPKYKKLFKSKQGFKKTMKIKK